MRRCVGLDLDLAKCGIGVITYRPDRGDCLVTSTRVTSPMRKTGPPNLKGKPTETLIDRHARIVDIANQACHMALSADLVVIENKFAGSPGGKSIDRHGAYWWVVGRCLRKDIPVVEVAPTSVKLAIAADGRADKAKVAGALGRLWPAFTIGSEDEADAVGLAHLGAVYLGWPVTTLERHRQVKASWPDLALGIEVA
jgi:Holliday junction resolvasome RuvABC endonuclease subunit